MKLNNRQKEFIREYKLNGGNGKKAALMAGYSPRSAEMHASRLLRNDKVLKELARREEAIEKKYEIDEERIIKELELIGFSDLKNYMMIDSDTGAIIAKGFDEMPGDSSRALESVSEDRVIHENKDGTKIVVNDKVKFKTHDKLKALEMICKLKGLLRDRDPREDEIPDSLNINLNQIKIGTPGGE